MQTTNDPLYTPLTEELSHENLQIAGDTSLIERRHRDEPEATSTAISMSSGEVYEGKDFVKVCHSHGCSFRCLITICSDREYSQRNSEACGIGWPLCSG